MTTQGVTAEYTVEGTTFAPEGGIYDVHGNPHKLTAPLVKTAEIAALCNDSKIIYNSVCHSVQTLGSLTEIIAGEKFLSKCGRAYGSCP
jgi:P-type Ca2+ transporter type 2A